LPKLSPKGQKYIEAAILSAAFLFACFFWNTYFIYPIKLFVVLLHESSHGLAAILSGGRIIEIQVSYLIGGHCLSEGGNEFIIANAGYLGSMFFGGMLFITAKKRKAGKLLCDALGAYFAFLALVFIKGSFGKILAFVFALFLILSHRFLPAIVHDYLMKILGLISCLYAIVDIEEDIFTSGSNTSDAHLLSAITGIPVAIWGILWIGLSSCLLFILIRKNFD
jgi:hypothetical protein